ncbi:type II toxin-antitoxin system Phd/YefM family antitoxin [Rickettsia australis]|uniref:Prevent-host-death family protein n=1 Tax=Rickettsia australis (strain Cutlack) TaxID=1105110 RepID=H8K9W3_RICAC|nr:prevent-host-death protein [Rickettsia australis]AFC70833.1 prevent-host-death family protein [Rickettsia australis str. Cutlack]
MAIISLEDHNSIAETLYLLKSLKNAERLKRAINDFEENKNFRNRYSSRHFEEIME